MRALNKRNVLFSLCLTFLFLNLKGQTQSDNWYFGQNAGISFQTGSPQSVNGGQINSSEGCTSISDFEGNLLFYSDGQTAYNKNHAVLQNGNGLWGNTSSTQSAVAIPAPGTFNSTLRRFEKYYLFTSDYNLSNNKIRYNLIDMSLDGGLGGIVANRKNVLLAPSTAEKICVLRHNNQCDFWVVIINTETNQFNSYLVNSSGINPTPVMSNFTFSNPNNMGFGPGYMKGSPDNSKVAVADLHQGISVYNFNNITGRLTFKFQDLLASPEVGYGIEFSPNSQLLYASNLKVANLFQYDVNAPSNAAFISSRVSVGTTTNFFDEDKIGALQLASDGKIYHAINLSDYLNAIQLPNVQGTGCNYQNNAISVAPNGVELGLPNFPAALVERFNITGQDTSNNLDLNDGYFCEGSTVNFGLSNTGFLESMLFELYDSAGNLISSSNSTTLNYTFDIPGTYVIKATVYKCGIDFDEYQEFDVIPNIQVDLTCEEVTENSITVSWPPVEGVSYYLYEIAVGEFNSIFDTTEGNSIVATELSENQSVTFTVTPIFDDFHCTEAATITCTTLTCSDGTVACNQISEDFINFEWLAVDGAESYNYEYSINGGTPVSGTTTDLSLLVNGLPQGALVSITITPVTSVRGYCYHSFSTECSTITCETGEVVCESITPDSVTFTWDALNGAESYNYEYSINGGTPVSGNTTDLSLLVSGLAEGSVVNISILAVDNDEIYCYETFTTSCTSLECSSANLRCGVATGSSVTFEWDAVTCAESYDYEYTLEGETAVSGNTTDLSLLISDLQQGTVVSLTIIPISGNSGCCFHSTTISCSALTCQQGEVRCGTPTASSLFFEWDDVEGAESYNYVYSVDGGPDISGNTTDIDLFIGSLNPGASVTITITPISSDTSYCFESFTATCSTLTCVTGEVFCGLPTTDSVIFSWPAAIGANSYDYQYTINGGAPISGNTTDLSLLINGLSEGDEVIITITPVDTDNIFCYESFSATCSTLVCEVVNLFCADPNNNSVTFEWFSVVGAESYDYEYSIDGATPVTGSTTDNFFNLTGLAEGTDVTFTLTPVGNSPELCYQTVTITCSSLVCLEGNISCGELTNDSVSFIWDALDGAEIYNYSYTIDGGTPIEGSTADTNLTINGLTEGAIVTITVTPLSSDSNYCYVPFTTSCSALNCQQVEVRCGTSTSDSVTFEWDAVTGAESYEYEYSINGGTPISGSTTDLNLLINGLDEGAQVTITISPISINTGYCFQSSTISCTALSCQSGAVRCGTTTGDSITFEWDAVTGAESYNYEYTIDGGTPITGNTTDLNLLINSLDEGVTVSIIITPISSDTGYCFQTFSTSCTTLNCQQAEVRCGSSTNDSVTFEWDAVDCAESYDYEYTIEGQTAISGNTTDLSLLISNLQQGAVVSFTITPISSNSSCCFHPTSISCTALTCQQGEVRCGTLTSSSLVFEWDEVVGAESYNYVYSIDGGADISGNTTDIDLFIGSLNPGASVSITITPISSDTSYCFESFTTTCSTITCVTGEVSCDLSTADSVTFSWASANGADSYDYQYTINGGAPINGNTTDLSLLINGLNEGDEVIITITPIDSDNIFCYESFSATCSSLECGVVDLLCGERTNNSITFEWSSIPGAESYTYEYSIDGATPVTGSTTDIFFNLTGLAEGSNVSFTLTPVSSDTSLCFHTVNITCSSLVCLEGNISCGEPTRDSVSFIWEALDGAETYNYSYSIHGGTPIEGSTTDTNLTINGLTDGAEVAITVTPISTDPNYCYVPLTISCSALSCEQGEVRCGTSTVQSVTFEWDAVSGADSYNYVYSINGGPATSGNTTDLNLIINGLPTLTPVEITIEPVSRITSNCFHSFSITCSTLDCPNIIPEVNIDQNGPICDESLVPTFAIDAPLNSVITYSLNGGPETELTITENPYSIVVSEPLESNTLNITHIVLDHCGYNLNESAELNYDVTSFETVNQKMCENSELDLNAPEGYENYSWYDSNEDLLSTEAVVTIIEPGEYQVIFESENCNFSQNFIVSLYPNIYVEITATDSQINVVGSDTYVYELRDSEANTLFPFQSSGQFSNLEYGSYEVIVKDTETGCYDSYIITLYQIANVVTPNDDGINDEWDLSFLEDKPNAEVKLYDRYGKQLLFLNESTGFKWNGKYEGRRLPTTSYWYIIKAGDTEYKGYIMVKNRE